jgi:hypothetical protein
MKIKFLLLLSCLFILSATYSQKVLSLHPLFTEQTAVRTPLIEGSWHIPAFEMTITFQPTGDNFYRLKFGTESNPSNFEAVFVKINGQLFLDLAGSLPDTLGDGEYRNAFIPAHTIYKVKIIKDSLYLYETDYSWFNHYRLNTNDSLKYEWIPRAMLLTLRFRRFYQSTFQ